MGFWNSLCAGWLWEDAFYANHCGFNNSLSTSVDDNKKALGLYRNIVEKYPDTKYATKAMAEIQIIKSKHLDMLTPNVGNANIGQDNSARFITRMLIGVACGVLLGLTKHSIFGFCFVVVVGAVLATFDLPFAIFGGVVGALVVVGMIVMNFLLG